MGLFSSLFKKKEVVEQKDPIQLLALELKAFTSNDAQKVALAKQLICNAITDYKNEYHYPLNIDTDLKDGIDFAMYSRNLLNLYEQQEREAIEFQKNLEATNYEDYDPRDHVDKNLENLDFFEINYLFENMVRNLKPREKFAAKLLIIDKILSS